MSPLTETDARALAHLMSTIRPDWDKAGCMSALRKVIDRDVAEVTIAAIRFARERHDQRTPAALAKDGKHWADPTRPESFEERKARDQLPPRAGEGCPIHTQNLPCPGCAADEKTGTPKPTTTPIAPDTYARGLAACRQALTRKDQA